MSIARSVTLLCGPGVRHHSSEDRAYVSNFPFIPGGGGDIHIGSDVRVCTGATILGGVVVGNAAIIGAGAVVSRDVPPFAVVAGNPARVRRFRFDEETIYKLRNIRWWDWPEDQVRAALPKFHDVRAFVRESYPLK